jgi:hypothetical protein
MQTSLTPNPIEDIIGRSPSEMSNYELERLIIGFDAVRAQPTKLKEMLEEEGEADEDTEPLTFVKTKRKTKMQTQVDSLLDGLD